MGVRTKKSLAFFLFTMLLGTVLSITLNLEIIDVSAVPLSPYLMVVPEKTMDPTIEPGMNYTISVYTDYSGNDIWSCDFSLTFDPSILQMGFNTTDTWIGDNVTTAITASRAAIAPNSEKIYVDQTLMTKNVNYTIRYETGEITFTIAPSLGAEVKAEYIWTGLANGDLITTAKNPGATFIPGNFDNTVGKLSKTRIFFFFMTPQPPPTTSGPGTLANVTFRVVGYGSSDIILGQDTKLIAPGPPPDYFPGSIIIGANLPPGSVSPPYGSDHIGNGYFENIHDVAITRVRTAPTTAIQGDTIAINVTVANGGDVTRTFNITVYANTALVGNQTVNNLAKGDITTVPFNWNTTTITAGYYIINATAWLPPDDDPKDNTRTATIEVKTLHDVALVSLEIPDEANVGDFVMVKVTVANQGTFEENLNLTVYYRPSTANPPPPAVMNTTAFTLGKRPTTTILQTVWNTTSLKSASYNITATITIDNDVDKDEDPDDNILQKSMALNIGHDVTVSGGSVTPEVFVGENVTISVTVQNIGSLNETLFEVKVTRGTEAIGSQQVQSLNVGNSVTLTFIWSTTGVQPGIYGIKAEAVLDTDIDPTNNKITKTTVVNAPVGTIAGTVKDASGNPIEGVTVTCGTYTNTTKADGSYRLSNVLEGNYTVLASKNKYQTSSQTNIRVFAGKTTSLNFTLAALTTGHITGKVTDASTGNPIEGAQVTVGSDSVSTNATGGYSIEIAAGTYTVTVSADGYQSSSETDVNVVAGDTTTVDLMLKPNEPLGILLYAAVAVVIIIVIAGTAIYLRRRKKTA